MTPAQASQKAQEAIGRLTTNMTRIEFVETLETLIEDLQFQKEELEKPLLAKEA